MKHQDLKKRFPNSWMVLEFKENTKNDINRFKVTHSDVYQNLIKQSVNVITEEFLFTNSYIY